MLNLFITLFMDIYEGVNAEAQLELTVKYASDFYAKETRQDTIQSAMNFIQGMRNGTQYVLCCGREFRNGGSKVHDKKIDQLEEGDGTAGNLGNHNLGTPDREPSSKLRVKPPIQISKVCRIRGLYSGEVEEAGTIEEFTQYTDFPQFSFYSGEVVSGIACREDTSPAAKKNALSPCDH